MSKKRELIYNLWPVYCGHSQAVNGYYAQAYLIGGSDKQKMKFLETASLEDFKIAQYYEIDNDQIIHAHNIRSAFAIVQANGYNRANSPLYFQFFNDLIFYDGISVLDEDFNEVKLRMIDTTPRHELILTTFLFSSRNSGEYPIKTKKDLKQSDSINLEEMRKEYEEVEEEEYASIF